MATINAIGPYWAAPLHLSVSHASQNVYDFSLHCWSAYSGVFAQKRFTDIFIDPTKNYCVFWWEGGWDIIFFNKTDKLKFNWTLLTRNISRCFNASSTVTINQGYLFDLTKFAWIKWIITKCGQIIAWPTFQSVNWIEKNHTCYFRSFNEFQFSNWMKFTQFNHVIIAYRKCEYHTNRNSVGNACNSKVTDKVLTLNMSEICISFASCSGEKFASHLEIPPESHIRQYV